MYFFGRLEIDPSQSTLIKKAKTSNVFSKFVDALTFGSMSRKQEHETFTAVSILQQIYMGLRAIKIDNIIRLSIDDYDFYLDETGEENDLDKAMFEFTERVDPIDSELFNTIFLVLEHIHGYFRYLIEIKVNRKHKVGEYPIVININAVLNDFFLDKGVTKDILVDKMKALFDKPEDYRTFVATLRSHFNKFLDELGSAAKKFIKVDDIKKETNLLIIRPKRKIKRINEIRHDRFAHPVYYGYYNFDNHFFYAWFWAQTMYEMNVYVSNALVVDEVGNPVFKVGEDGFHAGDTNTFNPEAKFEAPSTTDVEYFPNNEYYSDLIIDELVEPQAEIPQQEDYREWLDIGDTDGGQ